MAKKTIKSKNNVSATNEDEIILIRSENEDKEMEVNKSDFEREAFYFKQTGNVNWDWKEVK